MNDEQKLTETDIKERISWLQYDIIRYERYCREEPRNKQHKKTLKIFRDRMDKLRNQLKECREVKE